MAVDQQVNTTKTNLFVVSYNMHGYNQGVVALRELIQSNPPHVILLQETWLTPTNLDRFSHDFPGFFAFGCSALSDRVSSGPLFSRPYGGMMILLRNDIVPVSECIHTSERFVIVKVGDLLVVDVYLPCVGTQNRYEICSEILLEISSWRQKYPFCGCIIGGDFNTDLDIQCTMTGIVKKFLIDNQFSQCRSTTLPYTFVNETRIFLVTLITWLITM